jgi:hypothetical protein
MTGPVEPDAVPGVVVTVGQRHDPAAEDEPEQSDGDQLGGPVLDDPADDRAFARSWPAVRGVRHARCRLTCGGWFTGGSRDRLCGGWLSCGWLGCGWFG